MLLMCWLESENSWDIHLQYSSVTLLFILFILPLMVDSGSNLEALPTGDISNDRSDHSYSKIGTPEHNVKLYYLGGQTLTLKNRDEEVELN
ncbi:unnamed protein product [Allacma fusca]|uniref:Uncharacterized protein n=1 Tax=Allacma fusca TaxID=39272 RepID=A0A8J2P536_9HEXA|nr:unnamed protein product [Allacma fusca]